MKSKIIKLLAAMAIIPAILAGCASSGETAETTAANNEAAAG